MNTMNTIFETILEERQGNYCHAIECETFYEFETIVETIVGEFPNHTRKEIEEFFESMSIYYIGDDDNTEEEERLYSYEQRKKVYNELKPIGTIINESLLPLFDGFYGTIFDNYESWYDMELEHMTEEQGMTEEQACDKLNSCDTRPARLAVSQDLVDSFETLWNDNFSVQIKTEFGSLESPREYNFTNDKICLSVEFDGDDMIKLINANHEHIEKFIIKHFSDRSGFISYYSNNIKEWTLDDLEELDSVETWSILSAICEGHDIDSMTLYYASNIHEEFMNNVEYND